jgi:hypothetical protein
VVVLGVVLVVVHAHDDGEVVALRGRGDDDLLGAGLHVLARVVGLGEDAGRFDDDVAAEVAPAEGCRVLLGEHLDRLVPDADAVVDDAHVLGELAENRVVLEQVGQRLVVGEVVDRQHLDIGSGVGQHRAEHVASDAPETVDAYPSGHLEAPHHMSAVAFGYCPGSLTEASELGVSHE